MGSTKISQPAAPTPPTQAQTAADYAAALPIYYKAALEYEPQIAQMEKDIQSQLYPETSALQENLAKQASEGMNASLPDWYKNNVADTLKSQLGRNLVYNPTAQEDYGLKTNQAYKDWGDYYRNLGLSVTSRQPLTQPNNMMLTATPQQAMGYNANTYGSYSNVYGNMYGANAKLAGDKYSANMNMIGQIGGGLMNGIGTGMMM